MRSSDRRFARPLVVTSMAVLLGGIVTWKMLAHRRQKASVTLRDLDRSPRSIARADLPAGRVEPGVSERARTVLADTMRRDPDRLSTTAALPPFDEEAFERDPDAYLSGVEPSRCYQTRRPGSGVRPLVAKSDLRTSVGSGRELPLLVATEPKAPVTFTSFGGGMFRENGLSTVTVRADARGLASVHFIASAGLAGDIPIVAGSPMASGNMRFLLQVGG